jgi:hypothetical protein
MTFPQLVKPRTPNLFLFHDSTEIAPRFEWNAVPKYGVLQSLIVRETIAAISLMVRFRQVHPLKRGRLGLDRRVIFSKSGLVVSTNSSRSALLWLQETN